MRNHPSIHLGLLTRGWRPLLTGGLPPQRIFTRLVDRRYGIDRFIEEKRRVAFGDVQKAPDFGLHRNDLCKTPPKLPRETYREAQIPASKAHS